MFWEKDKKKHNQLIIEKYKPVETGGHDYNKTHEEKPNLRHCNKPKILYDITATEM